MRANGLDLNLLVVFDAVYSEQNLTRAAEILHITQPAVSNALARLRAFFGDPLFVRTAEGMVPTPAARDMIGLVRVALGSIDRCVDRERTFDPAASEVTLRCSFSELAEALLLPGLVARLQQQAPRVSLRSYYVPRDTLPLELAAGTLDIGVDVPFVNDANLNHAPLLVEEYVVAVREGHPNIRRKPSLPQYLELGHVHISGRRKGAGTVDQSLRSLSERRRIVVRARNYLSAGLIVGRTDLACTLPRALAHHAGLRAYALPFQTPPVQMHAYWHKSVDVDPMNAWFRHVLFECGKTAGGPDRRQS